MIYPVRPDAAKVERVEIFDSLLVTTRFYIYPPSLPFVDIHQFNTL